MPNGFEYPSKDELDHWERQNNVASKRLAFLDKLISCLMFLLALLLTILAITYQS
jgi:hypothetical protein